MDPMRHEPWCSAGHCTVADDLPADGGEHRSKPIALDMAGVIGPRQVVVQLSRVEAAWPTDTYLMIGVAGAEVLMPTRTAGNLLATVDGLLARTAPPPIRVDERAAEMAFRYGFPASADDDACPVDGIEHGTTWLGVDDSGHNWWTHDVGPEACGLRWSNPIRKPHNGVPIVLVTPAETICHFCGDYRLHATPEVSAAYGAAHTRAHEREVRS
ncbi:hypothetical protein ACN27G_27495 [Plantactinospora sp. WMMB334]|uniref:hypothetical protein n=1 Tax=Plantactinospora sp. WMMB334 TaxID=3404119 RepID=UPI003B9375CD